VARAETTYLQVEAPKIGTHGVNCCCARAKFLGVLRWRQEVVIVRRGGVAETRDVCRERGCVLLREFEVKRSRDDRFYDCVIAWDCASTRDDEARITRGRRRSDEGRGAQNE
jgi:hypothetical protein